jgi:hypothetical protein
MIERKKERYNPVAAAEPKMVSITCAVHDFPAMSGHPQHTFNTTISQEVSLIIDVEYETTPNT